MSPSRPGPCARARVVEWCAPPRARLLARSTGGAPCSDLRPRVMNEADPSPINLDELRMLPDWLREDAPPPSQQYASHNYPTDDRGQRRDDRRSGPGNFRGGPSDNRRGPGGPPDRRREGGARSGPPSRGPERGGDRGNRGPRDERRGPPAPAQAPPAPAPVRVEFVPDERCLASINKQIRTTHLAYPLFGLARMFLQEPARHFVQISLVNDAPEGTSLYQLGDEGIVTLDRAPLEKQAFDSAKDQYYTEETVQKEPLKGNFTNVARERLSGTLLGPTNYHAYQPALRALYDARYSRRMSFDEFRRNVEVSSDPALVEQWKEEARTSTTIRTRAPEGEEATVLNGPADARTHFRQHHLETLVRAGRSFKVHGSVARKLPEFAVMQAIREAHDREMRYPAQFVQLLRQGLQNSGLHIFKHRKRVVYVSLARPTPFVAQGTVTPGIAAILETIAQQPLCTRKALAERVIARGSSPVANESLPQPESTSPIDSQAPDQPSPETAAATVEPTPAQTPSPEPASTVETVETSAPDAIPADDTPASGANEAPSVEPVAAAPVAPEDPAARAKAALAADLRFLVQSGHIIEFHNGTFDLPLPPRSKEEGNQAPPQGKPGKGKNAPAAPRATEPTLVPVSEAAPETPGAEVPAGTVFAANGPGVEESLTEVGTPAVPNLEETIEPAPTADGLRTDEAAEDDRETLTVDSVVIEPAPQGVDAPEVPMVDKAEHDGLISGAGAAPLDLPVPGDTEDRLNPRP